jgi:hypothetical protein
MAAKVFTLGRKKHNVAGHGDSYSSVVIEREGMYETGDFPPLFPTKEGAVAYAYANKWLGGWIVVEMELRDE